MALELIIYFTNWSGCFMIFFYLQLDFVVDENVTQLEFAVGDVEEY